ncbi:MAG TPA: hypothetical protein VGG01_26355 [Xanthobacteraceae bacterium]
MSFEAFGDPFGIDFADNREDYGEDCVILFGMVDSRLRVFARLARR